MNDYLPHEKRARIRGFWEKGGPNKDKNPEAFLAEIERIFADSIEKTIALEKLISLKYSDGQLW